MRYSLIKRLDDFHIRPFYTRDFLWPADWMAEIDFTPPLSIQAGWNTLCPICGKPVYWKDAFAGTFHEEQYIDRKRLLDEYHMYSFRKDLYERLIPVVLSASGKKERQVIAMEGFPFHDGGELSEEQKEENGNSLREAKKILHRTKVLIGREGGSVQDKLDIMKKKMKCGHVSDTFSADCRKTFCHHKSTDICFANTGRHRAWMDCGVLPMVAHHLRMNRYEVSLYGQGDPDMEGLKPNMKAVRDGRKTDVYFIASQRSWNARPETGAFLVFQADSRGEHVPFSPDGIFIDPNDFVIYDTDSKKDRRLSSFWGVEVVEGREYVWVPKKHYFYKPISGIRYETKKI